jgi:hypothetical protein
LVRSEYYISLLNHIVENDEQKKLLQIRQVTRHQTRRPYVAGT